MNRNFAANGLQMLCETLEDRNQEIAQYRMEPVDDSYDDAVADCLVLMHFMPREMDKVLLSS